MSFTIGQIGVEQVGHSGVTVIVSGFIGGTITIIVVSHNPFEQDTIQVSTVSVTLPSGVKV